MIREVFACMACDWSREYVVGDENHISREEALDTATKLLASRDHALESGHPQIERFRIDPATKRRIPVNEDTSHWILDIRSPEPIEVPL